MARPQVICIWAFAMAMSAATLATGAELPAVEAFTGEAHLGNLVISPSGKRIAASLREPVGNVLTIAEYPSNTSLRSFGFGAQVDATDARFMDDETLLVQPARLLPGLRAGKVNAGEVLRVDMQSGQSSLLYSTLVGPSGAPVTRAAVRSTSGAPVQILSLHSGSAGEILVQTIPGSGGRAPAAAYRLNTTTGQMMEVAQTTVLDARFLTGSGGRIAVVYGRDIQGRSVVHFLPVGPGVKSWVPKVVTQSEEGELIPVAWTGEGEKYYSLDSRDASTRAVVIWNATDNTQQLLSRHPRADFNSFQTDSQGRAWVFGGHDEYPHYWYPDAEHPLAAMHRKLSKDWPTLWIEVTGQTDDLSTAMIRVNSAEQPPVYILVDVATAQPRVRMEAFPELNTVKMADVQPVEFAARDGLAVRGYLTMPRAEESASAAALPLIVAVHGGPFGVHDRYDYDFERQLFASRGYAVLQVNYRGSGGRGREYMHAGFGQWGRAMQDDITDGVRWAIEQGIADPARICIYGGSYGGYAALMGVAREPELFKCAVGYSGVYDLPMMFAGGNPAMQSRDVNYLKQAVGEDRAELKSRSPVEMAAKIRAKVLLIHGTDDFRAPIEHAQRMRSALIKAGNPPGWLVAEDESHGFNDAANRADAYRTMLNFFAANLGMQPEPPGPPRPAAPPSADGPEAPGRRFNPRRSQAPLTPEQSSAPLPRGAPARQEGWQP